MAVIFTASTGLGRVSNTSRILGPFFRWLLPSATDATISTLVLVVRKGAHAWEYALLAVLLWRALRRPLPGERRPWSSAHAWMAWLLAVAYAGTDEWHQSWVPGREGALRDVGIDAAGAAIGLATLWGAGRLRRWW
jgi:VanZ family protein